MKLYSNNNKEVGHLGESLACEFLEKNGYKIIERNKHFSKYCEIDIIAQIKNTLVFVEVKSRSNINYGYPCEAVNYKKKRKITNVAKYYILDNSLEDISVRFDVIEIYLTDKKINHIVNAF